MLKIWNVMYVTVTGETLTERITSYVAGSARDDVLSRKDVRRVMAVTLHGYVW